MSAGLIVRLRPTGPWRFGPDSGARERAEKICHSDTLYSAVSSAMLRLGLLEEWLDATARTSAAAVRFSSCFPALGDTLLVTPPRHLWPPPASSKVRWKGARFVPLAVAEALLTDQPPDEERWTVDGASECLVPAGARGPFRFALRNGAAVDRLSTGSIEPHSTACLEFTAEGGMWAVAAFADDAAVARWREPVKAAFRLLADSGLGGERSRGWGRSEAPQFTEGILPELLVSPQKAPAPEGEPALPPPPPETAYWLLSLFTPGLGDSVDWQRGSYALVTRAGRVESPAAWGEPKKPLRMVREGSVLLASAPPNGAARDVAPDGLAHPVFRAGFGLSIPVPWKVSP